MSKNIVIFSGLGADERIFQRINLSGFSTTFITWIPPYATESLQEYAHRILGQIPTPSPTLLGVSFGGIMAIEVSKIINTEKVIVISSATTSDEIPFYFRWAGKLGLHKLLPANFLQQAKSITNWFFGVTDDVDKEILQRILADTDIEFLRWAIDSIVRWKNYAIPINIRHIHGTRDRIQPFRFVQADIAVNHGGHLMVLNKSEELTRIIRNEIC